MGLLNRLLQANVERMLGVFPAVYINGPRQAGKTTLVHYLMTKSFGEHYVTFDDPIERAAAMRNPQDYLKSSGVPLIIDEVQMVPALFRPLKIVIDEARGKALDEEGDANGRYLLTGSANLMATPALADAMVGRMATLTLLPLSVSEVFGVNSSFIDRCFSKDLGSLKADQSVALVEAVEKASFPELLNRDQEEKVAWFENYIQKITLEDPSQLYNLEKAEYMPILLQSLAARAGSLVNDANIGREIGLNAVTTRHYRGMLSNTFVTKTLKPWHRNITKRLVKSSKIYFYDTMLLCHLLKAPPSVLVKMQPHLFGHVLENFVLSELMKANGLRSHKVDISFYRTQDGREVDFILEYQQKFVAIEVKHAEHITDRDLAGIKEFQDVVGKDFHRGIVLCNTPRIIPFGDNIYLVPFSALWQQ